ncbi:MAG: hypothetical protein ACRDTA_30030 [Pseudonocardiaceae bacterium]
MTPMIRSDKFLLEALRGVLCDGVQSGPGARAGIDSILHRAGATLYSLLVDHPVDRRGQCRSCRRPSAVPGLRRRHCQVRSKADLWLHLPVELFQSFLASELGLSSTVAPPLPARGSADPPHSAIADPDPRRDQG